MLLSFTERKLSLSLCLRYLARAILVPFVHEAPSVELGALAQIIEEAPATFPILLSVGKKLESMEMSTLQEMQGKVGSVIEDKIDSRLLSQYCISLFCAEQVYKYTIFVIQYINVGHCNSSLKLLTVLL